MISTEDKWKKPSIVIAVKTCMWMPFLKTESKSLLYFCKNSANIVYSPIQYE